MVRLVCGHTGAEYSAFILMLKSANLDPADWQIIDLAQEDMPPALLTGSIDIQISGIPQRLAVLKEGMGTLIDQRAVGETIAHCGFGAKRSWLDANADLAIRLQKVILTCLRSGIKSLSPGCREELSILLQLTASITYLITYSGNKGLSLLNE